MAEHSGQCLCGAVKFKATPKASHVDICHCNDCRRHIGGPSFAIDCADSVQIEGEASLGVYNSSAWAERGFCKTCGSFVFWRLKDKSMYVMPVGAFEDLGEVTLATEYFIDHKPGFYDIAQDTKKLTGEEVFALYAGSEENG